MQKVDLHTHTHYSDGELSPEELLKKAEALGLTQLAITDHDCVEGLQDISPLSSPVKVIKGVELSASWENKTIHVVGLQIDDKNEKLLAAIKKIRILREERANKIAELLEKHLKLENCYSEFLKRQPNGNITRTHIAQYLVAEKQCRDPAQAFKRYLGMGKVAYVKQTWLEIQEAIDLIHAAGGLAVLAHPCRYKLGTLVVHALIADFAEMGGDAIEVVNANSTSQEITYLAQQATRLELLASQGSDFHGSHMPWIKLGMFNDLPESCRPIWELWRN